MTTLCRTYSSEVVARRAVEALRAAGVPSRDIRVLTGSPQHDVRDEPVGGWAGAVAPDGPVGTYANVMRVRRRGRGAFAGDSDRQRQGSFADADRDHIVTYEHEAPHSHVTGDVGLRGHLRAADVVGEPADRVVDDVHHGSAVVLVEVAEIDPSAARAGLEGLA